MLTSLNKIKYLCFCWWQKRIFYCVGELNHYVLCTYTAIYQECKVSGNFMLSSMRFSSYSGTKSTVHVGGKAKQFSSLFFFLCVWSVHLLEVKKVKVSFKELWKNFLRGFLTFHWGLLQCHIKLNFLLEITFLWIFREDLCKAYELIANINVNVICSGDKGRDYFVIFVVCNFLCH